MKYYLAENLDIAVIGAGHAGIEAALAGARLGLRTAIFTISLDSIGAMPCNPSIGGTAKGQLVRELDCLGGEMPHAADATTLQSRMLGLGKGPAVHSLRAQCDKWQYHRYMRRALENQKNLIIKQAEILQSRMLGLGKGPAVHSLRAQCDKWQYHRYMRRALENQKNLIIKQAEITEIVVENGRVQGLRTAMGAYYAARCVIVATGTFLGGRVFVGEYSESSGPDGLHPSLKLEQNFKELGIALRRFKTGTPARVRSSSVDFSKLEIQVGDEPVTPFSLVSDPGSVKNILPCYIAYTNEKTHEIIRSAMHRSPLFAGDIVGIGPRYCPSIEDKINRFPTRDRHQLFLEPMGIDTQEMYVQGFSSSLPEIGPRYCPSIEDKINRFPTRDRHQLFLEPMGIDTQEMYVQGFSSSLPEDVQLAMYRSVEGMENVELMRTAYAIEYACIDPLELYATMEFKSVKGLYGAGQFCGTSGYEEAAAQGFVAGVNAAHSVLGKERFILPRHSSYVGTLIDDLVTKGCTDPYRMMTSRSEYRLLLRQDNADIRLLEIGHSLGLIPDERYEKFLQQQRLKNDELRRIAAISVECSSQVNEFLVSKGTTPLSQSIKCTELLRRPQIKYSDLPSIGIDLPELGTHLTAQLENELKYEGYIKKQLDEIESAKKYHDRSLTHIEDFSKITNLSLEAIDKLNRVRPINIAQAERISGVTPADITALIVHSVASSEGASSP